MSPLIEPPTKSINWPEFVWISLLIIGFILSMSTIGSAMMYYIVALLAGIFFGRLWYKTKKTLQFKYFMMIVCFMIGFILGNYFRGYGHAEITIIVLMVGIIIGFYTTSKGLMNGIDF